MNPFIGMFIFNTLTGVSGPLFVSTNATATYHFHQSNSQRQPLRVRMCQLYHQTKMSILTNFPKPTIMVSACVVKLPANCNVGIATMSIWLRLGKDSGYLK